jgi:glycosyltransferase involved in cell wall biosynthesis
MNAILTLTTIPSRLNSCFNGDNKKGLIACLDTLVNQSYQDYEIHFNIPEFNDSTGEEYVVPSWLINYSDKIKIYRTKDYGPITKCVPTLERVRDPEAIIVICDDDMLYHKDMLLEQVNNQKKFPNSAVGYDGIDIKDRSIFPDKGDVRGHFVVSINRDAEVRYLQCYKTVSIKRKFIEDDFFENFITQSWSDDIVLGAYLASKSIPRIVTHHIDDPKITDIDDWRKRGGPCKSFPCYGKTHQDTSDGCNFWRKKKIPAMNNFLQSCFKNER